MNGRSASQLQIDEALANLRTVVEQALRLEQLIDRLTSLPNDEALTEWIGAKLAAGSGFWVAFIEVDRFKSVNDEFGYEAADELLRQVAGSLKASGTDFRPAAIPFRAHGDEFYLCGEASDADVHDTLDRLRHRISELRVPTGLEDDNREMRYTVSIGWTSDEAARSSGQALTNRSLRGILETAVTEAKIERNRTVAYHASMAKHRMRSDRADCPACQTRFDVRIPASDPHDTDLCCPNCRQALRRPPALRP